MALSYLGRARASRVRTFRSFMLCMAKPRSSTSRELRLIGPFTLGVPAGVDMSNCVSNASRKLHVVRCLERICCVQREDVEVLLVFWKVVTVGMKRTKACCNPGIA